MDRNRILRMTIKTQNGKVITKDGKVSCECCEGTLGIACFYNAVSIYNGRLQISDLPDSYENIGFFNNETQITIFERSNDSLYLYYNSTNYANFEPGEVRVSLVFISEENRPVWYYEVFAFDEWFLAFTQIFCLFNFDFGKDRFANSYNINWNADGKSGITTVTRPAPILFAPNRCWKSSDGPNQVSLYFKDGNFIDDPDPQNYGWFWSFGDCGPAGSISPPKGRKTSTQNSPVGFYINSRGQITATVS